MSAPKIAFCFPGQGSLEAGMGREIALAVPAAMEVYERASEASGLDLIRLCFEAPEEELVHTEVQQPALVATSLAVLAALRENGFEPDVVVGHSVGEFAALAASQALSNDDAIRLVRARGLAMAEAARENPGSMAAILGLADEVVEALCARIANVWPANYNCPGQIVISGQSLSVDECCEEAQLQGARRTVKLRVSGAFHSPLVARAAEHLRPALDMAKFSDPIAPFMSTVTAKIEPAQRMAALLVEQLTAPVKFTQAARELMRPGREGLRRGRARERPHRFTEEDRQEREGDPCGRSRLDREAAGDARLCLSSARSKARRPSSPAARAGSAGRSRSSWRGRAPRSPSATAPAPTRPRPLPRRPAAGRYRPMSPTPDQAKALVEEAGDLDILVNNAGLTRDGLLARMPDADWRDVIETNLSSVFYTCRAAVRGMMKKRAGSIVNVSSIVGVHGNWGQTNYGASKAGIIGFTKSLARELGSRNVRANVVAPGYVNTRLTDVLPEEAQQAMLSNTPLGRLGEPEDIAGAVRFLCSDEAAFVTGEVLLVDGGLGM
jgi:malonyl CoA-acyl carrier protein transacylase